MKKFFAMNAQQRSGVLAALLVGTTAAATAAAQDPAASAFTMGVISNEAHGKTVTAGKYDQAIERIGRTARRIQDDFAVQLNLCVAYTKTGKIDEASAACDAAVVVASSREATTHKTGYDRRAKVRAYKADLGLALSNRGVLLAATGNEELAKQDFLTAIDLRTELTPIFVNNLERLDRGFVS